MQATSIKPLALCLTLLGIVFSASTASASAADDNAKLAERLIELRGKVETLHDEIQSKQRQHKNRMSGLAQRRAELEGQLQRQELEIKRAKKQLAQLNQETRDTAEAAQALRPAAEEIIQGLEASVKAGLPFTVSQRLAELTELNKKLKNGELSPPRVIQQLWSFVEDELRLCRENGLFRQTIELNGQEELADVIRLGMTMLFFHTEDGVYGYAQRDGAAWRYVPVEGEQLAAEKKLFDAFERQLRTGFFLIPNGLPAGGAQ